MRLLNSTINTNDKLEITSSQNTDMLLWKKPSKHFLSIVFFLSLFTQNIISRSIIQKIALCHIFKQISRIQYQTLMVQYEIPSTISIISESKHFVSKTYSKNTLISSNNFILFRTLLLNSYASDKNYIYFSIFHTFCMFL